MNQRLRHDGLMDLVQNYASTSQSQRYVGHYLPGLAYDADGIASAIIDRPAEDAVAPGFTIEGDDENIVSNELDRLGALLHLIEALRFARLYGASAILVLTEDGAALDQPLNPARLRTITDLVVYRGDAIQPEGTNYTDPRQRNYGMPEHYRLQPDHGDSFACHETRLIAFPGEPVSRSLRGVTGIPWAGRSALDGCREDLDRYRACLVLTRQIMERKQQAVHAMAGLTELIATAEGKTLVQEKIALTDAVRGLLNGVTIDGGPGNGQGIGDKYDIIDLSLGGIDTVLATLEIALCASARMTGPVLFGREIRGLGNTGEGAQSIYHGYVSSIRTRSLMPGVERLVRFIWAQQSLRSAEPKTWKVVANPLWSPSDKEVAEVKQIEAQSCKVSVEAVAAALDTGTISPEEGRDWLRETAYPALPQGPPPEPMPEPVQEGSLPQEEEAATANDPSA